jgi:arginyl-tRNA synthetase
MKGTLRSLIGIALEQARSAGDLAIDRPPRPSEIHVEVPREEGRGDLASNVAMTLARAARKPPRAIAEALLRHLHDPEGLIAATEVAGPGFLNFTFSPAAWRRRLLGIIEEGDAYGSSDRAAGKRVQVEFVSANPTGPMHIGHGRGAATGDALARILEAVGYGVTREYYVNDAGGQMTMLGRSVLARYLDLCGVDEPFPANGYPGDYVIDIARELRERDGDRWVATDREVAAAEIARFAGDRMLERIRDDLGRFNISFDVFVSERRLREEGSVAVAIEELRRASHCYEQDGALFFRSTAFGDDKDRALVKSDGELTYFASDVAYHRAKAVQGYDALVDVWGADHHGYVKRVEAGLEALGFDAKRLHVVLVQIVNLTRDGVPVKMGKRSGEFVALRDVLDEVGPDLARFFFLMRKSDAQLDFDLELARRQTAENPVFYVQYAHTRIAGILRQAAERGIAPPAPGAEAVAALINDDEIGLIRMLDEFPSVVEGAAAAFEPHRVVFYAQKLAGEFHRFYTRNKCVSDDLRLTAARLLLVGATKQVIERALTLVGVSAPERM